MLDDIAGVVDAGASAVADTGTASEIETPSTDTAGGGEPGGTGEIGTGDSDSAPPSEVEGAEPPAEGAEQPEGEADAEAEEFDGRMVDAKTRSALAALKKVDPASAKLLSDTYHRTARIIKDVGAENLSQAVNKVAAMAATLESVGGAEGLTTLNEEVEGFRNEATQFANGDPALPRALYAENQKGLVRSVQASLDVLAESNAEHFKEAIMPSVVQRLEQAGMYSSIPALLKLIEEGKGQEAYELTSNIQKWLGDAKSLREKELKVRAEKDPEREKFEQERADFEKQKVEQYDKAIETNVVRMNNASLARVIDPFLREIKVTDPLGRETFTDAVRAKISKAIHEDKTFRMQYAAIMRKGDAAESAEFINNKFKELIPIHFRAARNALYPNYASLAVRKPPVAKTNGAATPSTNGKPAPASSTAPTGAIQLAAGQRPKYNDVDWGKTDSLDWIKGIAVLTNGKRVKFDINAPANKF